MIIRYFVKIGYKNLKDVREWTLVILAIITLVLGILTLISYLRTNPRIEPDIKISLIDGAFFSADRLMQVNHLANGTFWLSQNYLNFKITNLGQKNTNYMNFYVKDTQGEYQFNTFSLPDLQHLNNTFFQINFWNKNCAEIVRNAIDNNQNFIIAYNKCMEVGKNLTGGKKSLLLKIDCPGCSVNKNIQCYSFNICIYNLNSSSCGDEEGYFNYLKPESCPKNWWS